MIYTIHKGDPNKKYKKESVYKLQDIVRGGHLLHFYNN